MKAINQHKRDVYEDIFIRSGALFVILGILSIIFEMVTLTYHHDYVLNESRHVLSKLAVGIWCGLFFIFTGICSITAGRKITSFTIVLAVTLVITSVFFAITQLTIETIMAEHHKYTKVNTSLSALHSVVAAIAIIATITGIVELTLFIRVTFCTTSNSALPSADSKSSFATQTEMTRDVRGYDPNQENRNGQIVVVTYHNSTNTKKCRLASTAALITNGDSQGA